MSETQQRVSPDEMRELAEKAREDDLPNLAEWLDECAEKEANQNA